MTSRIFKLVITPLVALFTPMIVMGSLVYLSDICDSGIWGAVGWVIRLILLCVGFAFVVKLFYKNVVKATVLKRNAQNVLLTYYTLICFLFLLEFGLTFYVQTTFNPIAYSNMNWYTLHWKPINSEGFRDYEFNRDNSPLALFIGDSFTAGAGIKNINDRVSNIIGNNTRFTTLNMGVNGMSTLDIPNILKSAEGNFRFICIQYYINDIIGTAKKEGIVYEPLPYTPFEKITLYSSYILNYFFSRKHLPSSPDFDYSSFINRLVNNDEIWDKHVDEIKEIKTICDEKNTPVFFIIYPYLPNVNLTGNYIIKLEEALDELKIEYVSVEDVISKNHISKKERVVNRFDVHPSVLLNQIVAEHIIEEWIHKY